MLLVAKELQRPDSSAQEVLRLLRKEIGLSESDIAKATGVSPRTVRRWLTGASLTPENAERLDDLRHVVAEMGRSLPGPTIGMWMRQRNRELDHARPLDVLAAGQFTRVMAAIESFHDGEFS